MLVVCRLIWWGTDVFYMFFVSVLLCTVRFGVRTVLVFFFRGAYSHFARLLRGGIRLSFYHFREGFYGFLVNRILRLAWRLLSGLLRITILCIQRRLSSLPGRVHSILYLGRARRVSFFCYRFARLLASPSIVFSHFPFPIGCTPSCLSTL